MEPIGYHVSLRLEEDRQIAVTPQQRRELARAILDVARAFELLAFRWADTHGHLLAMGDRATCAELVRRVEIAIQRRFAPGLPFARPRFRPVYSLWHLSEAFFYVLRQDKRHDLGNDPHRDASNLPDLLGARTRGVWTTVPVRANLARVGRNDLLEVAGWNQLGAGGIEHLEDAVVNAASLPALEGRSAEVAAARRAAWLRNRATTPIETGGLRGTVARRALSRGSPCEAIARSRPPRPRSPDGSARAGTRGARGARGAAPP